jgi:SAM-dependent methyltransferase
MIRKLLTDLKRSTEPLNYGREQVVEAALRYVKECAPKHVRVLDIGLGGAKDLTNIRSAIEKVSSATVSLHGVEVYPPNVERAQALGIEVYQLDIERSSLPLADKFIDIVVANQIVEHVKEVFWIFSEISRVLKPGGIAIIAMPNLASFHNRIALLFGIQPTCIEPLSAHVRGFTKDGFKRLIECDGYFRLINTRGSNFYPLPPALSRPLSRILPGMAVCAIYSVKRTDQDGCFIDVLQERFFETPFYTGEGSRDETVLARAEQSDRSDVAATLNR